MTWVKLDDQFWSNPKVQLLGNEAAGAYARMLSYCGAHLTDGLVSEDAARFIAKPKLIERLVAAQFIERADGGWLIPDFLDFNPSREQIEAKREADKRRKAA